MSKYNFNEIVNRLNSGSFKWDVKENELPMWVADMDFHVLPEIKEEIKKRIEIDAYGYSACPKEYFESYKNWYLKHHDLELKTEWMTFSTGVVASIDSMLRHIVKPGSGVVILSPVYHVFYNCIRNNGLKVVECPLIFSNDNYSIDFGYLKILLEDKNNQTLLLCNPHNPVGRLWSKEELKLIDDLCRNTNTLLISDEIHCDIVEPGMDYNSILSVTDDAVVLLSPTKTFNIAGIQTSVVVSPNQTLLKQIEDGLGKDDVGEPNYIASYATIAAYTYGEQWVKELNEYIFENKKYLVEFINKNIPDVKVIDNKATYLLWLDISHYSRNSEVFVKELRKETGLFVSPGKQFGSGGEGFIRINIATSLANVKDACDRLKKFLRK